MNKDIINKINRIPIFDIMSVRGYCVYIDGVIRTFVFAADIAREAGLTRDKTYYNRPLQLCPTSGAQNEYYIHNIIRWDRFNEYVNMSIESFKRINPSILPLIQLPIHAYSYIPCELALIVLMHCRSKKALDFQVKLATIIMPKIQQDTIEYYEEQIELLENDIEDLKECVDCRNISKMEELEEDNYKMKYLIKEYESILGDEIYRYQFYREALNNYY